MPLQLTITLPLSEDDKKILAAVLGDTPQPAAKAEPKPPKKAAAPEPAADGSPTMEDAVSRATTLVSEGKTAEVKAALEAAGAKRVSELKPAAIKVFLDAL